MIGIVNAGGGALPVDVVGGATKPSNPMENTIWVETTNPVTAWAIGYNFPDTPKEGMVAALCRGGNAPASLELGFPDTSVKISPAYYYQYLSGEWVSKAGSAYQNGSWADSSNYLYNRGVWNAAFKDAGFTPYSPGGIDPDIGHLHFSLQRFTDLDEQYVNGAVINLTGISKIAIEYTCAYHAYSGHTNFPRFKLYAADGTTELLPYVAFNATAGQQSQITTQEFDVSSIEAGVKLCFGTRNDGYKESSGVCNLDIYSIKLVLDD